MVFSSSLFLLYFLPFVLILYFIADKKYKNYIALLASLFFYGWGAPQFIFIVVLSVVADFFLIRLMDQKEGKGKKLLLGLSVLINIGLLVYFKYVNFFIDNVNSVFGSSIITDIGLPIGISFFSFQKMSYSVDVYRKAHNPLKKLTDYVLYILLFPQLIAGPIVRYKEIADQLEARNRPETLDDRLLGFYRFIIGLAKKVLIANVLGAEVDKIFALSETELLTSTAWIGIVAYAFQIYFDFSGYSDMAIGLGRILGFRFPENFDNPYISQSISEFWRRWHMTLGRWMKDYLYIPLGGNKVSSKFRLYFNLWLVFLISGLWHGAAWNFVAWGAFHGTFLLIDRLFFLKFSKKIGKWPSTFITFIITLVGWVIFRSTTMDQVVFYIKKMFAFDFSASGSYYSPEFWTILILGGLFAFLTAFKFGLRFEKFIFTKNDYSSISYVAMTFVSIILLVLSISAITSSGFNPFIYFRF